MASLESVLVTAAISEENKRKLNDLLGEDHVIYVPPFNFKTIEQFNTKEKAKELLLIEHLLCAKPWAK